MTTTLKFPLQRLGPRSIVEEKVSPRAGMEVGGVGRYCRQFGGQPGPERSTDMGLQRQLPRDKNNLLKIWQLEPVNDFNQF